MKSIKTEPGEVTSPPHPSNKKDDGLKRDRDSQELNDSDEEDDDEEEEEGDLLEEEEVKDDIFSKHWRLWEFAMRKQQWKTTSMAYGKHRGCCILAKLQWEFHTWFLLVHFECDWVLFEPNTVKPAVLFWSFPRPR